MEEDNLDIKPMNMKLELKDSLESDFQSNHIIDMCLFSQLA